MDIYFVRHGETAFNKRHVHQPNDAPLDEEGRDQARKVCDEVRRLKPTHFITSDFTRAVETADIINESGEYSIVQNELFRELERPTKIQRHKHFGLRSLLYMMRWFFGTRSSYWETHGGESRRAFLARVYEAKKFLETLPSDARVVIVSHSVFINFFIQHICNETPISSYEAFFLLMKITKLDNTAIRHISYNPDFSDGVCKWSTLN